MPRPPPTTGRRSSLSRQGAKLNVPKGFQVEIYQEGFKVPRFMMLGPSNEVLLADSARGTEGTVYVLQGKERKKPSSRDWTGPTASPPGWLPLRRRTRIHQAV